MYDAWSTPYKKDPVTGQLLTLDGVKIKLKSNIVFREEDDQMLLWDSFLNRYIEFDYPFDFMNG